MNLNRRDDDKTWHLDKRFSVGHMITTMVVGVSALLYITALDKRITLLEQKIAITDTQHREAMDRMTRQFQNISAHLIRIEAKIEDKQDRKE